MEKDRHGPPPPPPPPRSYLPRAFDLAGKDIVPLEA